MTPNVIIQKLNDAGYTAYFVGGCVRDRILGRNPKDEDVATNATPDQINKLFEDQEIKNVGAHFGVVMVDGTEVATFRSDHAYTDGRHPEKVTYETDPKKDAERRDFTMNAMFMDAEGKLLDFFGGRDDILQRTVRCVGNPLVRFQEDKLRMLRAIRFATRFRFSIQSGTFEAIQKTAGDIFEVSPERIQKELVHILTGADVDRGLHLLHESKILGLLTMRQILDRSFNDSRRIIESYLRAHGTIWYTSTLAIIFGNKFEPFMRAMKFSNDDIERVRMNVTLPIDKILTLRLAEQKRIMGNTQFWEALKIHEAVESQNEGGSIVAMNPQVRSLYQYHQSDLNPKPLINGNDLIQMSMVPGPKFATILREVEDAQLENRVSTRDEALEFVRQYVYFSGR
jgi:tRNA nucleotidyltransferase/poly(A) polymerase